MTRSAANRCVALLLCCGLAYSPVATAEAPTLAGVANANRAQTNYMSSCQGCHGQHGSRSRDGAVPALQNYVGNFLRVPGGRAFLVQVPGSANAAISDAELAELLNWILHTQSAAQLTPAFEPFTALEVEALRKHPESDVIGTRAALVRAIERTP